MRLSSRSSRLHLLFGILAVVAACAGDGKLGAPCESHGDCRNDLQCQNQVCIARCLRGPDCGDGYACRTDGTCSPATVAAGDSCSSETECAAGLACRLDNSDPDRDGALSATCTKDRSAGAFGSSCLTDNECRHGACALGHCLDLCANDRDCARGNVCMRIPRVEADGAVFRGCLPERDTITWDIRLTAPAAEVLVPVPDEARGMSLAMTVEDDSQLVGATYLTAPGASGGGRLLFDLGADYYSNLVRHRPSNGVSVIQIPSSTGSQITPGAYRLSLSSLRPNGEIGSAVPRLRVAMALGPASIAERNLRPSLALHFHFVDLSDHPCRSKFPDSGVLNASTAPRSVVFEQYLQDLRNLLPDIAVAEPTYDDLPLKNVRDNIAPEHVRALLKQGRYADGVNVFFVRSMSPAGTRAIGPTPGPTGLKGTGASGIILSMEQLCYVSWHDFARTTSHQLARYLGLFPNLDSNDKTDPIDDTGTETTNLMFFSDQGGTFLTKGQRDILLASPVLQ